MTRDTKGSLEYWNRWVAYRLSRLEQMRERLREPSGDPTYRPRYAFDLARNHWQLMFCRYSRGDNTDELLQYFAPLMDAWEKSNQLDEEADPSEKRYARRAWAVNFDHYVVCFWLVGLALALEIPDDQWDRLLALIGNEGEDILLDRIIASRSPQRRIGTELCFKKPYARLLEAIDAPRELQPLKLLEFVTHWYSEMAVIGSSGRAKQTVPYLHPYWYRLGNENFEGGAYFGRWCVEAVAAAKAFGMDDDACQGHQHYPGDLFRPGSEPVEPNIRWEMQGNRGARTWLQRVFGPKRGQ